MTDDFELDNSFELDGFVNFLNTFYEYYDKTIENMDFNDEKYRIGLCCKTAILAVMTSFCNHFPDLYEMKYEKENNKTVRAKIGQKEII